jgi:WD40 repeat protein/nucleoside phosphorylase
MSEILDRYTAENTLSRFELEQGDRACVDTIIGLMDADGLARVSDVLERLFPMANNRGTANRGLQRRMARVNELIAGSGIMMRVTEAKAVGAEGRFVWFEGPSTWSPTTAKGALDAIPAGALLDQSAVESGPAQVAVLITFNQNETQALWKVFRGSDLEPPRSQRDGRTYYEIGTVGGFRVIHAISQQATRAAQTTGEHAVRFWSPTLVIACGIAFGIDRDKQRIGDVLVSQATYNYNLVRMNPDGSVENRDIPGEASLALLQRAYELDQIKRNGLPEIHLGVIVTGEALIDNVAYRDCLKSLHALVIGGEMEGSGIREACRWSKTDWAIVKGICDWGDGDVRTKAKQTHQKIAAKNAAMVTYELLRRGPVTGDSPPNIQFPEVDAMGYPDAVLGRGQLIPDQPGARLSMAKNDPTAMTIGTPVLDAMMSWASNPASPPVFALLGEYGMGKTVTSQRFARELELQRAANPTLLMPLYFDLKLIAHPNEATTLESSIVRCMQDGWIPKANAEYDWKTFLRWLRSRPCVVIFDGLDEMLVKLDSRIGDAYTQRLLGVLDAVEPVHRPKVVFTCRTQYFPTLRAQRNHFLLRDREDVTAEFYQAMTLLPLDEVQIRRYLEAALPSLDTTKVMNLVRSVHNLSELAQRPVTLKLITDQIPRLEEARAVGQPVFGVTLYRNMVQTWLDRDDTKHYLKREHKLRLAADLAAEMSRTDRTSLPTSELEDWFLGWRASDPTLSARYANFDIDRLEEDLRTATFLARDDYPEEGELQFWRLRRFQSVGALFTNSVRRLLLAKGDLRRVGSHFRFAHTSLREFFLALYLFGAIRDDTPERWSMPTPSDETFDFLGQLIAESEDPELLETLSSWRRPYRRGVTELLMFYSLHAGRNGLPIPALHGIELTGAHLEGLVMGKAKDDHSQNLDLSGADFTGAHLQKTVFASVDLTGGNFRGAHIEGAAFIDARVRGCSWPTASVDGAAWGPTNDSWTVKGPRNSTLLIGQREDSPTSMAWSPDGKRLVTCGAPGLGRVWDPTSGSPPTSLEGHVDKVSRNSWSPDGGRIASFSDGGTVRVWDSRSGACVATLDGFAGRVTALTWSPGGTHLSTSSDDGTGQVWDMTTRSSVSTGFAPSDVEVDTSWSPDGSGLLTSNRSGSAVVWNAARPASVVTLSGFVGPMSRGAWSPDGERLAVFGDYGEADIWDPSTGECLKALTGFGETVIEAAWSPDGKKLFTVSLQGTVRIWNPAADSCFPLPNETAELATHGAWSPDGTALAIASKDGTVAVWDLANGVRRITLVGHTEAVTQCAWSPDGKRLATTSTDGTTRVWDATSGACQQGMIGVWDPALRVAGTATWQLDGTIHVEGVAWRWLLLKTPGGRPRRLDLPGVVWEPPLAMGI